MSIGVALLAALAAAAIARAAITVNATVTAGSTLSVSSLNSPSFSLTLTGDDQTSTYQTQLQVIDSRGLATGGGWNITLSATQFSDGSGHTIPTGANDQITTVTSGCHTATSTCTLPTNSVSNTNINMPSSATKILNAANATGLGRIDINVNSSILVPANTIAATYTRTLTVAIVAGP